MTGADSAREAARRDPLSLAVALIFTSVISVQCGAAVATDLFDEVGFEGAVALRLALGVPLMLVIWPPRGISWSNRGVRVAVLLGVVLGAMNFSFYAAIERIPLGIAVTLEFLGPLTVAIIAAHRRIAILWALLAGVGVFAIMGYGDGSLDPAGVVFALIAGTCWGLYVLIAARVAQAGSSGAGVTIAICAAALLTIGPGALSAGSDLLAPSVLAIGAAVALLASVIPYSAEVRAMRRIPPATFGVLMSLEPAVAALVGFVLLDQGLSLRALLGIVLVVIASAGALRLAAVAAPVANSD